MSSELFEWANNKMLLYGYLVISTIRLRWWWSVKSKYSQFFLNLPDYD